jgi:hypothetical protein
MGIETDFEFSNTEIVKANSGEEALRMANKMACGRDSSAVFHQVRNLRKL